MRNDLNNRISFCKVGHSFKCRKCIQCFQWVVVFTACLWFIATNATADQVYVWEDNNGVLHFGDSAAVSRSAAFSKKLNGVSSTVSYIARSPVSAEQTAGSSLQASLPKPANDVVADNVINRASISPSGDSITLQQFGLSIHRRASRDTILTGSCCHAYRNRPARSAAAIVERALRLQADDAKRFALFSPDLSSTRA
ncbi:MAG: DUF4124 domain-containing protein [Candidatus Competibacteraceae bacterium]